MAKQRLLSKLMESTATDLKNISGSALRDAYKSVAASLRGRIAGFKAHDRLTGVPQRWRSGVPSVSSFDSESEMRSVMRSGLAYLRGSASTYAGYEEAVNERRQAMEQALGREFDSQEEFDAYGEFMGEMQTRLGSMFKPASDFIADLWDESKRLNLDPNQLMKNYEYWRDHLDDLKDMSPIEGRNRALRPSDYIKKANLEKITDYYNKSSSHNVISSAARKPSRGRKGRK